MFCTKSSCLKKFDKIKCSDARQQSTIENFSRGTDLHMANGIVIRTYGHNMVDIILIWKMDRRINSVLTKCVLELIAHRKKRNV